MSARSYFVTGASGMIGRELLRRIAIAEPDARICVLLRGAPTDVEARAAELGLRALAPRLVAVAGDLARLRSGLTPRDVERVCGEVTHVIHLGAAVRFDLDLAAARQVNVFGTSQLLDLAHRMRRLERFVHVSTAFVAGDRPGSLPEAPAVAGRSRNTYEASKLEAERLVEQAMSAVPALVVRPSIVGPALASGADEARFLLLLALYLERGWRWVPGSRGSLVDLVPADLVARALHGIATSPGEPPRWLHVAAGPRAATLGHLGAIASHAIGRKPLRFLPPRLVRLAVKLGTWGRRRSALERATPFVPYLSVRTRVDTLQSERVLGELDIEIPFVCDYFRELIALVAKPALPAPASEGARPRATMPVPRTAGNRA